MMNASALMTHTLPFCLQLGAKVAPFPF